MNAPGAPFLDHLARLAAGQACLDAALHLYLPRGLSVTCCCDPDHIAVGQHHAKTCDSPGKMPMHKWKELQTRCPTTEEVQRFWHDFPYGNCGCVLGQVSGMVRVDVDGEMGEALLQGWSQGDLPHTWIFRSSPACRGVLYQWPSDLPCKTTSRQQQGDHRELRLMGNGSQTVLPPSRHPSGSRYTWVRGCSPTDIPLAPAPQWLRDRLQERPAPPTASSGASQGHTSPTYDTVARALAMIPNNDTDYDTWLAVGMSLHSTGEPWACGLWESWSRQSAKFDASKQAKAWLSFDASGKVQVASLFHLAKHYGWTPTVEDRQQWRQQRATTWSTRGTHWAGSLSTGKAREVPPWH